MDPDAFAAAHEHEWGRLAELTRRRRLSADEVDEMATLYRRTATHLSQVTSTVPDAALSGRLSVLLNRARHTLTGAHSARLSGLGAFVLRDFPAALFRIRHLTLAVAALGVLLALASGSWVAADEELRNTLITPQQARQLAQHDFEAYYSQYSSSAFSAQVWTNNSWVVAQSVAFGITGFWPVWVVGLNMLNVGVQGGVLGVHGGLGDFFSLILPHGLLELTCIFIGCAAGLKIFWALVAPGPRTRAESVAREARILVTVALGLVPTLLLAGLVEGFVTPTDWPDALRIGIGAAVWAGFLVYAYVLGGRAVRAGHDGDLDEAAVGAAVPVSA